MVHGNTSHVKLPPAVCWGIAQHCVNQTSDNALADILHLDHLDHCMLAMGMVDTGSLSRPSVCCQTPGVNTYHTAVGSAAEKQQQCVKQLSPGRHRARCPATRRWLQN